MKVKVFWVGQSASGNHYIGVQFEESGFIVKKFVQVTAEKAATITADSEITVPRAALS